MIHLFTTSDWAGPRRDDLARLIGSVVRQVEAAGPVRHHLLLQNCDAASGAQATSTLPSWCRVVTEAGRLSLSAARNRLIAEVLTGAALTQDDLVAFPDDDCWFPDGLLAGLRTVFRDRAHLDLLIGRIADEPSFDRLTADEVEPAGIRRIVRLSTSNSVVLCGHLLADLRTFDPALGLGTPARGGEDTDFAIRAALLAREVGFVDRALFGHPAPDRAAAARYFPGALRVLADHAWQRPALMREFGRKVLVGAYFAARGDMRPRDYAAALGMALPRFVESRRGPRT